MKYVVAIWHTLGTLLSSSISNFGKGCKDRSSAVGSLHSPAACLQRTSQHSTRTFWMSSLSVPSPYLTLELKIGAPMSPSSHSIIGHNLKELLVQNVQIPASFLVISCESSAPCKLHPKNCIVIQVLILDQRTPVIQILHSRAPTHHVIM